MKHVLLLGFLLSLSLSFIEGKEYRKSALKGSVPKNGESPTDPNAKVPLQRTEMRQRRVKFADQVLDDTIGRDPLNEPLPERESTRKARKKKLDTEEGQAMVAASRRAQNSASTITPKHVLATLALLFCLF